MSTKVAFLEDTPALTSDVPCVEPMWSEVDRLTAIDRYSILDTGREADFDEIAALAAEILETAIAVVNLIAADRQRMGAGMECRGRQAALAPRETVTQACALPAIQA